MKIPGMKLLSQLLIVTVCFFAACKKQTVTAINPQLYPLAKNNKWIYIDSFFTASGVFYGLDSFTLKTAEKITRDNRLFTPVTDQYDDAIYILSSTDTTVRILSDPGAALLFRSPLATATPVITTSYFHDSLKLSIFTGQVLFTSQPSYKIIMIQDDGLWQHYKEQELYFTPGIGIIKGRDIRKTAAGNTYAYDSYRLVAYSLY